MDDPTRYRSGPERHDQAVRWRRGVRGSRRAARTRDGPARAALGRAADL